MSRRALAAVIAFWVSAFLVALTITAARRGRAPRVPDKAYADAYFAGLAAGLKQAHYDQQMATMYHPDTMTFIEGWPQAPGPDSTCWRRIDGPTVFRSYWRHQ